MAISNLGQKFTQTYPSTTIYWHTCKFTRKLFCSPIRRKEYSVEGERLKQEYSEAIKAARKQVSSVYFYQCPETGKYFTTRTPGDRYSEEGKRIVKERELAKLKEYRQRPEVKERERKRLASEKRKAYVSQWQEENKERRSTLSRERQRAKREAKPTPTSCPVYFLTCQATGNLFTSRTPTARLSKEGIKQEARQYYHVNKERTLEADRLKYAAAFVSQVRPCRNCGSEYKTTYNSPHRFHCSMECATDYKRYTKNQNKSHEARCKKFGVPYKNINPYSIFHRDKWTCQLCGIATPRKLRGGYEPNAPEIDHIIPLSKGGGHVEENLQCACRKCNSLKGDKV